MTVDADLFAYLEGCTRLANDEAVWGDAIRLTLTGYLADAPPPDASITSVRAIVVHDGAVLVLHGPDRSHVLPGGRREPGETLEQTLHREILEETGWKLAAPQLLGCIHLHHETACPPDYHYPYPDFIHVVYISHAATYHPTELCPDDIDGEAVFTPLQDVQHLRLTAHEQAFLAHVAGFMSAPGTTR